MNRWNPWNKENFYEAIIEIPWAGCWVWMGYCKPTPSRHYMQPWMTFEGKTQQAAKVAWKLFKGPLVKGEHVLHTCSNCYCVNPAHLYIGNHKQNMADMVAHGRGRNRHSVVDAKGKTN